MERHRKEIEGKTKRETGERKRLRGRQMERHKGRETEGDKKGHKGEIDVKEKWREAEQET
jgi:hypothetical protein